MKNIFRILIVSLVVLIASTGVAIAATESKNTQAILDSGQTHNGLYARAAERIAIEGTVNGDVWLAGDTVEVNGEVRGNVYAAASTVLIRGRVSGSVHVAASTVDISGNVSGSIYAAGSSVLIADSSNVNGAVALAGSTVKLGGSIGQQAYIGATSVDVSARIGQYARLYADDIALTDTAVIAGDLTYQSPNDARIANDRAIGGVVNHEVSKKAEPNPIRDRLVEAGIGLVFNLVIGFCLITWAPRLLRFAQTQVDTDIAGSILKGLAFMFVTPFALILVAITIIGLPLALIGLLLYIAILLTVPALTGHILGVRVLRYAKRTEKKYQPQALQALLVGSVLFTLVSLIPFLGGLASTILAAGGAGALVGRGLKPLQLG